jgi:molybdenum cofactor synthesis domain-containing protein
MVSLERACELLDRMNEDFYRSLAVEEIGVEAAPGRRLAEDAVARTLMPQYDLCTMDGYAVRAGESGPRRIIGEAFAGRGFRPIGPGEAVYVTTGARLPAGADAVLPVEDASVNDCMLTAPPVKPGTFVVRAGTDFAPGGVLLPKGSLIVPGMAGVFRAAGIDRLIAYRRPRVTVIPTGDEIRDGTVADSNGPMVSALLESWGCEPRQKSPVGDDPDIIGAAIAASCHDSDFIVTIGGVSMGKKDFLPRLAEAGEVIMKGVKVKPGKPFIASRIDRIPLFSLPGKPSGSYAAMELFVRRFLLGEGRRHTVSIPVSRDVHLQAPGFDYVVFVELSGGRAMPLGYEGSSLNLLTGSEYNTSLLSTSARTVLSDGYFIARDPVKAGQPVTVNLCN